MTHAMKNRGSYRSDEQRQPPPVRQHKAEVHPQQRQRYRLLNFRECGCRFEPRDRYRCKPYQLTRRSPLPKEWFHIAVNKADSIRMAHTMTASKKSRRRLRLNERALKRTRPSIELSQQPFDSAVFSVQRFNSLLTRQSGNHHKQRPLRIF